MPEGELFRVSLLDQGGPLARPARAPAPRGRRPLLSPPRLPAAPLVRARNSSQRCLFWGSAPGPGPLSEGEEAECGCGSVVVMGGRVAGGVPRRPVTGGVPGTPGGRQGQAQASPGEPWRPPENPGTAKLPDRRGTPPAQAPILLAPRPCMVLATCSAPSAVMGHRFRRVSAG